MSVRTENGTAVFNDASEVETGLREIASALGMEASLVDQIASDVLACFDGGAEVTAEELQKCIQDAFTRINVGRVICGGACIFFAGAFFGSVVTAYVVTR